MSQRSAWANVAERGSLRALALLRGWYGLFGRRASVALLLPIVTYFYLTGRGSRRASRDYLDTLWATPEGRARLRRGATCSGTCSRSRRTCSTA